jgi:ABC-type proline/glycine betaine transport system substrate-binding protein
MKTTRIVSLFAAAMSIILAATASAAPASKRIGPSKASASGHTTSTPVVHKAMKRVGPIGKGYVCNR